MAIVATRLRPRVAVLAATAALIATACGGAPAQSATDTDTGGWPAGNVEMLVGYAAGGSSDVISRAVARGLGAVLDAPFRITNREGGNGAVAAAELAAAPPDGSQIAIQNASLYVITPLAVNAEDALDIADFDVVHGISSENYVLVANPATDFRAIGDMRAANRTIRYGTAGVGTGAQLSAGLLMKGVGVSSEAVPYDSGAPNLAAVLANEVDVAVIHVGEAIENIRSGKLLPLAVFSPERISVLPEVPTAREHGIDVVVSQYRFMTVPKGTPALVTDKLAEGMKATFATEAYKKFNEQNSLTPMEVSGQQVVAMLAADKQRYAEMVATGGIDLHDIG
ncbi:tripartite tricarboxylate transporter substrate binding protein [Mycobacterium sp. C31M]